MGACTRVLFRLRFCCDFAHVGLPSIQFVLVLDVLFFFAVFCFCLLSCITNFNCVFFPFSFSVFSFSFSLSC